MRYYYTVLSPPTIFRLMFKQKCAIHVCDVITRLAAAASTAYPRAPAYSTWHNFNLYESANDRLTISLEMRNVVPFFRGPLRPRFGCSRTSCLSPMLLQVRSMAELNSKKPFYVTTPIFYVNAGNYLFEAALRICVNYLGSSSHWTPVFYGPCRCSQAVACPIRTRSNSLYRYR